MERKTKILIVDDEVHVSKTLTLLLEARGYDTEVAETGEEALVKALHHIDIILLDLVLPDASGFDICRKLKEEKATRDIPIIILSVRHMYEDKVEGLYLGADDYLTKPFEYEELFARIEAVLRRKKTFSQNDAQHEARVVQELRHIVDKQLITPFFQPIFFVKPTKLLGVEVLMRPPSHGLLSRPDLLFEAALRYGQYCDLEILGWKKAFAKILESRYSGKIFLNCNPYFIESSGFHEIEFLFKDFQIAHERIVLEITERSAIKDYQMFYDRLKEYQQRGFSVAIDDAGGGFASLESIVETNPQFVKIDLGIVRKLEQNALKRSVVKFISSFCKENNIISIAEGIEEKQELDALLKLDVDAGQGYFLGKPNIDIQTKLKKKKNNDK